MGYWIKPKPKTPKPKIKGFPGHSNPPSPPTTAQYKRSKHFRKMRILHEKDLCMELIELLVNLDN